MEDGSDRRKLDHSFSDHRRHGSDDGRPISFMARSEEEIFNNVSPTTVSMPCPPEKVGPLIGKKGVVVQEIMRRSSCRIYVDQNFPEGHPRQIQLTGHPKDLSIAIALVMLVMEHGPAIISPVQMPRQEPFDHFTEPADTDFLCPPSKVGALIGPKGSNVHEIHRRTGCRVQVLQDGCPDGVDRRVSFSGNPQQIAEAKALAAALISGGSLEGMPPAPLSCPEPASSAERSSTALAASGSTPAAGNSGTTPAASAAVPFGSRIQESDIEPDKVRLVIGAKGVTIGEIMKRSGCRLFINQNFPEGQPHKVVFTGTPQQIDVAKYLVDTVVYSGMAALYAVLNGTDSIVIQEMNLLAAQAIRLQAMGGEALQDVQARCSVKVTVDPADAADPTARVSIIGKIDNVHSAIKLIYLHTGSTPVSPASSHSEHFGGPPLASSTAAPATSGPILALGKDGTAGHLESATTLPDGCVQQVAEIKNDVMGRVVGARSANLALIKTKSGASVQVLKSDNSKGTTRLLLFGAAQSVGLAAQMVQEVLVNGTAKLLKMADAVLPAAGKAPLTQQQHPSGEDGGEYCAPQQPQQPYYAMTMAMAPGSYSQQLHHPGSGSKVYN